MLVPAWLPKRLPKPSQIIHKSIQNRIGSEKHDFSKNSTSPRRDTHFGGSRVPKTLPKLQKPIKNPTKISIEFSSIFYWFYLHFGSLLGTRCDLKSLETVYAERGGVFCNDCARNASRATTWSPKWAPEATPRAPKGSPRVPKDPKKFLPGTD